MNAGGDFGRLVAALRRADDLESAVRGVLPPERWRHSEAAARLAGELADRYGYPEPEVLRRAALLHDVGRVLEVPALRDVSDWYGWPPDEAEWGGGADLLHGPAGAAVATALGLTAEGAAAVRYHVTGRPALEPADKIIMAADAAEETRPYAWAAAAREALNVSLELAVAFWVYLKVEKVRAAGLTLHPRSAETLAAFDETLAAEARRLARPFL
jgi:putative nucleotidyltransferase with HDIG domain